LPFEKDYGLHDACELRALQELSKELEEPMGDIMSPEYNQNIPNTQAEQQAHDEQNDTNLGGSAERHLLYSTIIFPKT